MKSKISCWRLVRSIERALLDGWGREGSYEHLFDTSSEGRRRKQPRYTPAPLAPVAELVDAQG